ncbi:hypothetical protein Ppb6_02657 [Photorhabdus australis subsp. thailandensis]|uniref:Uncharacterized protein n=1 Tax=Photorhabdus australis subsp. thailandensis TaxID=2805096 RepID=A0A1C0U2H7_9GAMM|nr:hypothetical protein Ppb6_02657 [Photorhabdus australis subsp. thailandensis]
MYDSYSLKTCCYIARKVLKQLYEDRLILIQQTEEIEGTLKSHSWQTAQWQQCGILI